MFFECSELLIMVVLSRESRGVGPRELGPYTAFCIEEALSVMAISKGVVSLWL